ncbi:Phosphate-selective porin O and P [Arenibacter palladensis]|uniref:Phosphate-selective porin O and P n=2 Tax=Arenibacter palladensis TaxID=237373 RepID=A0A1M4TKP6_9FLAO|nr:Phosphate-selective porin O and P [Arenibacter palladensis]
MNFLALGLMMCSFFTSFSQETNSPEFGKGLFNLMGKDSTWSAKIAARMQLLSSTTWTENSNGNYTDPHFNALIRRARLKFDGFVYSPKLSYKLELGLSNRDISGSSKFTSDAPRYILDAVIMWNFYQNFELWAGQTKLPGNIERVISSGNLQLVDRSLLNGQFTLDRDMGIQLRHYTHLTDTFVMREILSISQGEGRNITTGNLGGHQYSGRLELLPFGEFEGGDEYSGGDLKREKSPKLMLAATYNLNLNAVKTRGSQGTYMETDYGFHQTDINTLFIDAAFKYNGFSFMGEYAHRDAQDPFARNIDGSLTGEVVQVGHGLNLQAGYLFKSNWEVSGRYTNVKLNKNITGENPENQYTLGLSKYIVGHKLKVQTDMSYLSVNNGPDELMYRLQLDVHF